MGTEAAGDDPVLRAAAGEERGPVPGAVGSLPQGAEAGHVASAPPLRPPGPEDCPRDGRFLLKRRFEILDRSVYYAVLMSISLRNVHVLVPAGSPDAELV